MENKFRNELEITLGGEKILLRPTFENIAAMESAVGSVQWLTWKYSRGLASTKPNTKTEVTEGVVKALPSLSEVAQIVYFNQAAVKPDDATQKKFSLEEVWDLVQAEGARCAGSILVYLGRITAGNKAAEVDELSENEKKS